MQQAILDAARDLFVAEGYENVSIRKIAERVEYSPSAIYGYFAGKEDIFFALAETGFRLFFRSMKAVKRSADPLETLRRAFWQYYQFSKTQPEYFALMFVDRHVPRISREWERLEFMRQGRDEIAKLVQRCIETGVFPRSANPDAVFHILAAAIHGASAIRLSDRFIPRDTADALAHDVLDAAIAGLRHGVATTFDARICFHTTRLPQSDSKEKAAAPEPAESAPARKPRSRRGTDHAETARAARPGRVTKRIRPTL
jgi:AcrR family transcriptional regulator